MQKSDEDLAKASAVVSGGQLFTGRSLSSQYAAKVFLMKSSLPNPGSPTCHNQMHSSTNVDRSFGGRREVQGHVDRERDALNALGIPLVALLGWSFHDGADTIC